MPTALPAEAPSVELIRYHGLGNDYLVLARGPAVDAALVRAICDRHTGVGSDGLLVPAPAGACDHGVRIWNPDGSIAEKSGNGLRIYARWLSAERGAGRTFSVWTGTDRVTCEVDGDDVAVEMGTATFDPARVPADRALIEAPLDGAPLPVTAVGLGNPHCVLFVDGDPDALPWRAWGAALERHPAFPNRTNVQVARPLTRGALDARVWERGAGETAASGSSACAVAAAAVRTGRADRGWIRVQMPGGALRVEVREGWGLRLEGPVERVGRVEIDPAWWARRKEAR